MSAPLSPSGEAVGAARGFPRVLTLIVILALGVRLIVGSCVHLTEDEAYYRLWSMSPAFGYYDHPPMIAWWIWLGRHLVGDTPLGVRLAPIVAGAAMTPLVFDLVGSAGGSRRDAVRAAVWYNAMPLVVAGGLLAVPDAPAAFFWVLTLWCAVKAARGGSRRWWVAAGLAAGLACLSKYSALFLAPGILLWLAWRADTRRQLLKPGPWIAAALAVTIFSVNLIWNADHHWLTMVKQFGRIRPAHFAPGHVATFLAAQLFLINPLIAVFLVRAVVSRRSTGLLAPFIATSAPFCLYLLVHGLHDSVQAHWPAPIYPALAICAAIGAGDALDAGRWTRARQAAPWLGLALYPLVLLALALPASITSRIAAPLLGWPDFARQIEMARSTHGAAWIGTASYGLAAQLADEPVIAAPILQIAERERYLGLNRAPADLSRPGLIVDLSRRLDPAALSECFSAVTPVGSMKRVQPSTPAKTYVLLIVSMPRRDVARLGCWPTP